jgi:hypothetical protein
MSTMALGEGPGGVALAWETAGEIHFARLAPGTDAPPAAPRRVPEGAAGGAGARKHPALAVDARGEVLIVWTEGTGWNQGGGLAWQVFDKEGNPTAERGRAAGAVPVWGLPTAVATESGFVVVH